jgi:4-amino-4-deoxy-L-arabinose transferase-like glycosyltransferase
LSFLNNKHLTTEKKGSVNDYIFLALITLIVALLAYYRAVVQMEIGPIWDTADFLSNAMYFAGQGFGYADLTRPPFLPFLTSLLFRMGLTYESTIFFLDSSFLVLGAIGLYLFFRVKFQPIISFLGSLIFSTFPLVILFTGVGLSDIPSVTLSIWAVYATFLAVKKDSKFFYLSFPLAMLAFLTRYPAGFIIFPIFFYLIINRQEVPFKNMMGGMLLSILPGLLVISFFYGQFGDAFYPFSSFYSTTQKTGVTTYVYYHPDPLYFLKNMLNYIGVGGMTIAFFAIISVFIYSITQFNTIKSRLIEISKYKLGNTEKLKVLLLIILFIVFILSFANIHYMLSEILFFTILILAYYLLKGDEIQDLDVHFLFISWFMAFFIFHSVYTIKDDRYFITMAPALSYFLILAFKGITNLWPLKSRYQNLICRTLIGLLIVIVLLSTVLYIQGIPDNESDIIYISNNIQNASQWIKDNDPQYMNKVMYSEEWPQFSWYLRTDVRQMPSFNTTELYENQLNINKADYYLSVNEGLNLTNYQPVKQFGIITIYKRKQ